MRKKLKLSLVSGLSCLSVLGFIQTSNAQVCTPGQTIERDVAHNQARTGDGPLFEDGSPLIRQTFFTAERGYIIVGYNFIVQSQWGKTSHRINEFAAGTNTISVNDVQSAKRDLADYIGGRVDILDKVKIDARQRLEQVSSQYVSLAQQASTSHAKLELTLEAIPRSQKRTSNLQGFLRVKLRCIGFTNQNEVRLALQKEVDRVLNQAPPSQPSQPSQPKQCPDSYSKQAFSGRTGQIAFFNEWNTPVTVILYHPSNGQLFSRYTVPPKQNNVLGDNVVIGDDWGVCFENKPNSSGIVNNAGAISDYNPNWQGRTLFMIQNPRIR